MSHILIQDHFWNGNLITITLQQSWILLHILQNNHDSCHVFVFYVIFALLFDQKGIVFGLMLFSSSCLFSFYFFLAVYGLLWGFVNCGIARCWRKTSYNQVIDNCVVWNLVACNLRMKIHEVHVWRTYKYGSDCYSFLKFCEEQHRVCRWCLVYLHNTERTL